MIYETTANNRCASNEDAVKIGHVLMIATVRAGTRGATMHVSRRIAWLPPRYYCPMVLFFIPAKELTLLNIGMLDDAHLRTCHVFEPRTIAKYHFR